MKAWTDPFSVKGQYSRDNAPEIAVAASLGYLSAMAPDGYFAPRWHVTAKGLEWLMEQETQE